MRNWLITLSKFLYYRRPEINFNGTVLTMLVSSGAFRLANQYRGHYGELRNDK